MMQMVEVHDEQAWLLMRLDVPLTPPGGPTAEAAARVVGNSVQSREPCQRFGVLAHYDEANDHAVVIAHGVTLPHLEHRVWSGSLADYHADWKVD